MTVHSPIHGSLMVSMAAALVLVGCGSSVETLSPRPRSGW